MFICKECAEEDESSLIESTGPCERCGEVKRCMDVRHTKSHKQHLQEINSYD